MEKQRTAWHYFFNLLLMERGSKRFEYHPEELLTQALQHMDWLVVFRRDLLPDAPELLDPGTTLVGLWTVLPDVSILEYKSASRGYRLREINRLMGYSHQYFSAHADTIGTLGDLMAVLIVSRRNEALMQDLTDNHLRQEPLAPGYTRLLGQSMPMMLVDLSEIAAHEQRDIVSIFADGARTTPEARDWWYAHYGTKENNTMDPSRLEGFKELERKFLASVSLEDRLAGITPEEILAHLKPEERLVGLKPEERLAGLTPEQSVLALPDVILAQLPESLFATLPNDVREVIRARIGRLRFAATRMTHRCAPPTTKRNDRRGRGRRRGLLRTHRKPDDNICHHSPIC
jgi:hypothetical protein